MLCPVWCSVVIGCLQGRVFIVHAAACLCTPHAFVCLFRVTLRPSVLLILPADAASALADAISQQQRSQWVKQWCRCSSRSSRVRRWRAAAASPNAQRVCTGHEQSWDAGSSRHDRVVHPAAGSAVGAEGHETQGVIRVAGSSCQGRSLYPPVTSPEAV